MLEGSLFCTPSPASVICRHFYGGYSDGAFFSGFCRFLESSIHSATQAGSLGLSTSIIIPAVTLQTWSRPSNLTVLLCSPRSGGLAWETGAELCSPWRSRGCGMAPWSSPGGLVFPDKPLRDVGSGTLQGTPRSPAGLSPAPPFHTPPHPRPHSPLLPTLRT